jgi:PAS domain S-box-containing protein
LLSITLKSIGDGVVTTDKDGMITSLNTAAQEITGWSEQEAQNASFSDVFQ